MSDRYGANIEIGGQISRSKMDPDDSEQTCLEALLAAINNESVSRDYGGKDENPANEQELLELIVDGHLCFKHEEIRNGEFEQLESDCRRLGLSFDRHSEAYCEYDAQDNWWRPGMEVPGEAITDVSGHPVVLWRDAKKILDAAEAPLPDSPGLLGANDRLMKLQLMLKVLCAECEAPELPKFEIVD